VSVPLNFNDFQCRLESRVPVLLSARQRASVAIILGRWDGGTRVLFIRRAEHPNDPWSGHMAFPGGRKDPTDPDDLATAKRETFEEVGLDLDRQAILLGRLDDITATARGRIVDMVIAPFVFSVETATPIVPTAEVVSTVWAPIQPLFNGDFQVTHWVDLPEGRTGLPAWDIDGNIVWGLTFRMLTTLLSLVRQ